MLAILDLIMKRFQQIRSGMEPYFDTNVLSKAPYIGQEAVEAAGVRNTTFLVI